MGMPITVEVVGAPTPAIIDAVFAYFDARRPALQHLQGRQRDRGHQPRRASPQPTTAPRCARCWRSPSRRSARPTAIFDIRRPDGSLDPSGIVKGWAIRNAAAIDRRPASRDFYRRRRRRHPVGGQERRRRATGASASATRSTPTRSSRSSTRADAASRPRAPTCAASTSTIRTTRPADRRHRQPDRHRPRRARGRSLRHRRLRHGQGRHPLHRADAGPRGLRRRRQRPRHPDQRLRSRIARHDQDSSTGFSTTSPCTGWCSTICWRCSPPRSCSASSSSCRTTRPRSPSRRRLIARRLLDHQPDLRARLRRAGQQRVGLHHRAHPGADPRPGDGHRPDGRSARWSSPRSGRWPRSSSSPSAASTSSIRPPSAWRCPRLLLDQPATWWVGGNLALLPLVLIGGLLIVRKLQRFDLVGDLRPREPRRRSCATADAIAVRRPRCARRLRLLAALLLRLRHADRAADGADDARGRASPSAPSSAFLFAPEHPHRLVLLHAGAGAPRRQSVRLCGQPEGPLRADAGADRAIGRRQPTTSSSGRRASSPSGRASISNGRLALDHADNRGNRRYFTIASAPTEEHGPPRRQVLSGVERLQARARRHAARRHDPCLAAGRRLHAAGRPGHEARLHRRRHRHHAVPQHAAVPARPRTRRGRSSCSTATRRQQDIAYRDVLDAARARTRHQDGLRGGARMRERGQYPGFIDARLVRRRSPTIASAPSTSPARRRWSRRSARCCWPWAFAARGSRWTSSRALPESGGQLCRGRKTVTTRPGSASVIVSVPP